MVDARKSPKVFFFASFYQLGRNEIKVKIKCPACNVIVDVDSTMSGQVVDCSCGKKLRVPTVKTNGGSTDASTGLEGLEGLEGFSDSVPDQSMERDQSADANAGPNLAHGASEPNPFTTRDSINPYAASDTPYGVNNQMPTLPQQKSQGLAIASLVLGILSLSLVCCGGFVIGIPALICGFIAIRQADRGQASGKGMAIAGVTTGAISVTLFLAYLVLAIGSAFFS